MRSNLLKSVASVFAVIAMLAFVAGGVAMAQDVDSKPKMRGNAGFAFGQRTISFTPSGADDIEGLQVSAETNLFFEGSNGTMDYQIRMRFRGQDNQNEAGDSNAFVGNSVQTYRGYVRWNVSDTFSLTIAKPGGPSVVSATENDPVQLHAYGLYGGDLSDRGMFTAAFKFGGGSAGIDISPSTAGNMTTRGSPGYQLGGSGGTADNNNMTLAPWVSMKFGSIGVNAHVAISSGDVNGRADDGEEGCGEFDLTTGACIDFGSASTGVKDKDYGATGVFVHLNIGLGGSNSVKVDIETAASDLATGTRDHTTAVAEEQEYTGIGVKVQFGGLVASFASGESAVGANTNTRTDVNAHYQIPAGKGAWWAPQFTQQTNETVRASTSESVSTALRLMYNIGF